MAIVYLHIRNDTNNVFYVGIGKSDKRAFSKIARNAHWHNVVNKFGYQVNITHTDVCWEEACVIEKYLISFYREILGKNKLCNINDGGNGNVGYVLTEEDKKKISISGRIAQNREDVKAKKILSLKKYYQDPSNVEKNRTIQKQIWNRPENIELSRKRTIQLHLERPEIAQKISIAYKKRIQDPKVKVSVIDRAKKNFHSKYVINKSLEKRRTIEVRLKQSESIKKAYSEGRLIKKVVSVKQYTKDGEFIKEWESISDAAKELKLFSQNIYACCAGKSKICGGFIWRYKNSNEHVVPYKRKYKTKKVHQYSLDGIFINTWDSAAEIEKQLKIHNVYLACTGKVKQLGGYKWSF